MAGGAGPGLDLESRRLDACDDGPILAGPVPESLHRREHLRDRDPGRIELDIELLRRARRTDLQDTVEPYQGS